MLKNEGETMLESEDASLDETEAPMDHDEVTNGRRPTHRGLLHLPWRGPNRRRHQPSLPHPQAGRVFLRAFYGKKVRQPEKESR